MATLDPSHNPLRKPQGRHAQAVYDASAAQDVSDSESDESAGERRARKEGRKRVRAAMPPLPDQRFEQVRYVQTTSCSAPLQLVALKGME